MTHFRRTYSAKGFSLVELLVALVFMGVLMTGMLRVFGSALNSFHGASEAMSANRAKRWALNQLVDDLQSAGYFFPIRPVPNVSIDTTGGQNAMMIFPNQTVPVKSLDPATGQLTTQTITFDEVQVVGDQPLPIQARLAATPTDIGTVTLNVISGDLSQVRAGDYLMMLDAAFVVVQVASVSGQIVTLNTDPSVSQDPATGLMTGVNAGLNTLSHQSGADVFFVRPNQVVRYTILPLSLDPGNAAAQVPCLVRDQTTYPPSGIRVTWPASTASPLPAGFTRTVIAENIAGNPTAAGATSFGLRVDLSVDSGTTWSRTGAADWPAIVTGLNTQLKTLYPTQPANQSITNPSNPIWFRNVPAIFRMDLTTRTTLERQDLNNPNLRTYRYRSQTLIIRPRNFTFGLGT
ncbi:MAG TPA: prepilin-type N-terminal cleavage/methylation domain-containing protein [Geothrix sp.]|jgi:prepilin-type N-terminal cleavage/methylation domain-containing protein